jgi:hypothetical protein
MLATVSHSLPLTLIRRERLLPLPGRILVRKGQKVGAADVIGEYKPRQDFYLVDIPRVLGISADRVDGYIQCEAGSKIAEGDIIAGPAGFTRKLIRSPKSGKVILTGGGQVLIEFDEQPLIIKAGFSGEISELVSDRGVIVEAPGSLIQGVWGNGQINSGPLVNLTADPDSELTSELLNISQRGAVILAGYCQDGAALEKASKLPVRGLILGSLKTSLKKQAEELPFPLIVLDGFGHFAINHLAYKLLTSQEQREVCLNAEGADRFKGSRPEIVIPLPASEMVQQPNPAEYFSVQQKVRVLNYQHARSIGVITMMKGWVVLPNGLRVQAAEVRMDDNGEKTCLPLQNLEIVA